MYILYPFAAIIWLMIGAGLGVVIFGLFFATGLRKMRKKIALLEKEKEKLIHQLNNF
jgi:hypothetical protein